MTSRSLLLLLCFSVYLVDGNTNVGGLIRQCRASTTGGEYIGSINTTRSGLTCQRWDSQTPHTHPYTDPKMFPDFTFDEVANNCRNPDINIDAEGTMWCYTTDPDVRWDHCDVPECPIYPECKVTETGTEYLGTADVTRSDRPCLDYCRNPDSKPEGPWCYVEADDWEYCEVNFCKISAGCHRTSPGREYVGTKAMTQTGRPCQRWDSQTPHRHTFDDAELFPDETLDGAANYCRSPDGDPDKERPWCFSIDPEVQWEYCDVPECTDCKHSDRGREYAGALSMTVSGLTCQRWDSQAPHPHSMTDPYRFPDAVLEDTANFCRNPDGDSSGPWCYTTDPDTEREYCDLQQCIADGQPVLQPITRHVVHIGVDGLKPSCFPDAPGGAPNILQRLGEQGAHTLSNGRTTLQTVSAPGWSAHLCGISVEASGITGNGWRPSWRAFSADISPITGNDIPIPCVFQSLRGQDNNIRTAMFHNWDWHQNVASYGAPGSLDYEWYDSTGDIDGEWVTSDIHMTGNASEYLANIFQSSLSSYTFLYISNCDVAGHDNEWCSEEYLDAVAGADAQVGTVLDVIDDAGMEDEVVVFLSTDHGGNGFSHGAWHDSDIVIPMFVRGPGIKKNHPFEFEVRTIDIAPTAAYLLGQKPNPWWSGRVMEEILEDNDSE